MFVSKELDVEIEKLQNLLFRHVVPLYKFAPNKRPELVGTGFLVRSGKHSFLVTAAHVISDGRRTFFYIGKNKIRNVVEAAFGFGKDSSQTGFVDVSVYLLREELEFEAPMEDKVALNVDLLHSQRVGRSGCKFILTGFPASKSKTNPNALTTRANGFCLVTDHSRDEVYDQLGLRPGGNLVIQLDRNNVATGDGSKGVAPDPHGMSGSPVWCLDPSERLNGGQGVALVGVAIEYRKNESVVVSVDIKYVKALIERLLVCEGSSGRIA